MTVTICGDSHGNIQLTPGQSWVVPLIDQYVEIRHAYYIDSSHAYIKVWIGNDSYAIPLEQNIWYDLGPIRLKGDVQIRDKRFNHICVIVPDSWITQPNVPLTIENYDVWVIDTGEGSGLVKVEFDIVGDGSKTLEINWGGVEISKYVKSAGNYSFARPMNSGTHQICGRLL